MLGNVQRDVQLTFTCSDPSWNISQALDLAVQATQICQYKDWWWKVQLGKCYYTLGLVRDAEQQLKSALKDHKAIETILRLIRVYVRLDQPLAALDTCKKGLDYFANDVTILTEMGRIFEGLNNMSMSMKYYKMIAQEDASHTEAIASIGMHHFYNDQPELALRYYRCTHRICTLQGRTSRLRGSKKEFTWNSFTNEKTSFSHL